MDGAREDWIGGAEALARLGVRPQTLYAYVSRGRIEARADSRDPRRSLYRAADIAALTGRKARGRRAADIASGAIDFGEPILETAISTVVGGRLYYRGYDAVRLADAETFEGVARLLRGGAGLASPWTRRQPPPTVPRPRERLFLALSARAAKNEIAANDADEAASLLDLAADAVIGEPLSGAIHERLARAWGLGAAGGDLLRRALVLLADNELDPSTFAARVAAANGAPLAAAALAGLATLAGARQGGMAEAVARLAAEAQRIGPREAVVARLFRARAERRPSLPGAGHRLYPEGDPRARALLGSLKARSTISRLADSLEAETGEKTNVDFALAALAEALSLPADAPFCLFAVARCAGWTAHALEQGSGGGVIRPRARYAGRSPTIDRPPGLDRSPRPGG